MRRWRETENYGVTKYGCSILSQRVGCKGFSFECKNGLTQIVVSLFFLYMALIGLKERHFLSRERSCRFWLLSLRIECRLLMQLKLNPTVYCALLSTSLYMTLYITLVNTKMPAELYHGPLRSQENLLCDTLPIPSYRAGTLTNTPHHTFTSCFPICEEQPSQGHHNPLSLPHNLLWERSTRVKL